VRAGAVWALIGHSALASFQCPTLTNVVTHLSLEKNGDHFEQRYWAAFASQRFPSYEAFWLVSVAPLTYRAAARDNIRFRTTAELNADGYSDEDVAIAQLHYTFLLHAGRVFDLLNEARAFADGHVRKGLTFDGNHFFECFTRLSGASDVADEILERNRSRGTGSYPPWDEAAGARARRRWRDSNQDPLKDIRGYRNRLVHGRVVPHWSVRVYHAGTGQHHGQQLMYPRIDAVERHLDWRDAFNPKLIEQILPDFQRADELIRESWERLLDYAENTWSQHLL
jgi:hypothetical protein